MTTSYDAIAILPGGIRPAGPGEGGPTGFVSSTYEESDAFGTLGGRERVDAAAILAAAHPRATLLTLGRSATGPAHADIMADELVARGVAKERILRVLDSLSTGSGVAVIAESARTHGWNSVAVVTSEYHIPRVRAFFERLALSLQISYVAAEEVLSARDPAFASAFLARKATPEYKKRLASEARGIAALERGEYRERGAEDKKERSV